MDTITRVQIVTYNIAGSKRIISLDPDCPICRYTNETVEMKYVIRTYPFTLTTKRTGLRELASESPCHSPGQCWIVNQ